MPSIKKICKHCKKIFFTYPCHINNKFFCSKKCTNLFRKGIPLSKECREKIRQAFIGKKNHFYGKHHSKKSKEKNRKSHMGKTPWNKGTKGIMPPPWNKKGFRISHGYIYILNEITKQYKKKCRLVMEKHIGRILKTNEIVHHINEIKTDDKLENLKICSRAEHLKIHYPMMLKNRK